MAKYEFKQHENTPDGSKNTILTWIANELAETNRLKRLELQDKIKGKDEEIDWDLGDKS